MRVLSYGGGRQTTALLVLAARGVIPRPERIVMADTGRESSLTWAYLADHVQPYASRHGMTIEVAPHALATVDLYAHNGDLLIPAFTARGKLPTFCSGEWKARVCRRYLRSVGVDAATFLIGYSADERHRARPSDRARWPRAFPLIDLGLTTGDCHAIVRDAGLPEPRVSACWCCPHRRNAEWRDLRRHAPEDFARAVALDAEVRGADLLGDVYLHRSGVALAEADLDAPDDPRAEQCSLGVCFV